MKIYIEKLIICVTITLNFILVIELYNIIIYEGIHYNKIHFEYSY